MNAASAGRDDAPVFTRGSIMRHVAVTTATGSIGLAAVFAVDFLSLFWVARLGSQALIAAVGDASKLQFLTLSFRSASPSPFQRPCRARSASASSRVSRTPSNPSKIFQRGFVAI
jgi:hypothetical protein